MIFNPPDRDNIIDGKTPEKTTSSYSIWFNQIAAGINFITPTLAAGQTASIDFTGAQKLQIWPGFLVLLYTLVASGLTVKLPTAPQNSLVVIASEVGVASNVVINGTWTLTPGEWLAVMTDGTNWYKVMGGSL